MLRGMLLWASENPWCRESLPRYGFVRRAVRRFMPGEEAEAALDASQTLARDPGVPTLITYLGENVADAAEARAVTDHYIAVLGDIRSRGLDVELSVKPTHMGLDLGADLVEENLEVLVKAAADHGNFVWVDMESSRYVDPTLDLYSSIRRRHPNVGLCLQSYLHRTAEDLEALIEQGAAIRLVKGAYAEPPDVAMPDKGDVDESYFQLACRLLEDDALRDGTRHGFGTHDQGLIARIRAHASERGIAHDRFEVQQLYGITTGTQRELSQQGQGVRVLISYGNAWFPWYMRRLAERPANLWFVMRSMIPA